MFLSISLVHTPPKVSIPKESGVTSSNNTSLTSPESTPPWIAAPIATHSSGLMPLKGSLPVIFLTSSITAGIRVEPPTKITLSISEYESLASSIAFFIGITVASTKSAVIASNFCLVKSTSKCLGPVASAVIKGRLMLVLLIPESSIFAFSAASFNLCIASLSPDKSMPSLVLNSETR